MQVTPTLELFVDPTETPPYYWFNVTVPVAAHLEIVGHDSIPSAPFENDVMHVVVHLQNFESGPITHQVLLGGTSLDPSEGVISVHLIDSSHAEVGNGTIGMEQAQEQTRPTPPF